MANSKQALLAYTEADSIGARYAVHALPWPDPHPPACATCPAAAERPASVQLVFHSLADAPPLARPVCTGCACDMLVCHTDAPLHITDDAPTAMRATLRLEFALNRGVRTGERRCPALYVESERPFVELVSLAAYCDLPEPLEPAP